MESITMVIEKNYNELKKEIDEINKAISELQTSLKKIKNPQEIQKLMMELQGHKVMISTLVDQANMVKLPEKYEFNILSYGDTKELQEECTTKIHPITNMPLLNESQYTRELIKKMVVEKATGKSIDINDKTQVEPYTAKLIDDYCGKLIDSEYAKNALEEQGKDSPAPSEQSES